MVNEEQRPNELKQNLKVAKPEFDDCRNAEAALRESEERHRTILEGIEEGYVEVDLKGNTVLCNDSFCRIIYENYFDTSSFSGKVC